MTESAEVKLPFNMERQSQTNWCWAATAKSVFVFYSPGSHRWTQCKIAKKVCNKATCCTNPSGCNSGQSLRTSLQKTGNYVSHFRGTINKEAVKNEIGVKRRVLGVRIEWNSGGGHFVVIYGFKVNGDTISVWIDDPLYGEVLESYQDFKTNYLGISGAWSHTYYTDRQTAGY